MVKQVAEQKKRGRKPKEQVASVCIEFERYRITGWYGEFNVWKKSGSYVKNKRTGETDWVEESEVLRHQPVYLTSLANVVKFIHDQLWADLKKDAKNPKIETLERLAKVAEAIDKKLKVLTENVLTATGKCEFIASQAKAKKA
jgi:hypothetical protein